MRLKKRESLLRSTENGQIGWVMGLGFLLFLGIFLCVCIQLETYRASAQYLEDALAASNLAAAVVDIEEYGISHELKIADPQKAYSIYRNAVRENLNLNEAWECPGKGLISGTVRIEQFIVYNVRQNEVEVSCFDADGTLRCYRSVLGQELAPNGMTVQNTGIYSEIAYTVKGILGIEIPAKKGKLADVCAD